MPLPEDEDTVREKLRNQEALPHPRPTPIAGSFIPVVKLSGCRQPLDRISYLHMRPGQRLLMTSGGKESKTYNQAVFFHHAAFDILCRTPPPQKVIISKS